MPDIEKKKNNCIFKDKKVRENLFWKNLCLINVNFLANSFKSKLKYCNWAISAIMNLNFEKGEKFLNLGVPSSPLWSDLVIVGNVFLTIASDFSIQKIKLILFHYRY